MSKQANIQEIYVALLDEGTEVWRPVPALKVGESVYVVLRPDDYDPEDERWQYPPGSVVECSARRLADGEVLAATKPSRMLKRTA